MDTHTSSSSSSQPPLNHLLHLHLHFTHHLHSKKMASPFSHFTPTLYFLFILSLSSSSIQALNITSLLSAYPDLSDFTNLLSSSLIDSDLNQRSSVTLLAVPNTYLRSSSSDDLTHRSSPSSLADILRYHVLLEYFSWPDLKLIPANGKMVTTLFQTTGRATNNYGSVNLTRNPADGVISVESPYSYSAPANITILSLVKTWPYNVSIFTVNSLIVPDGLDLMASDFRPPLGLDIKKTLMDGHSFNIAASMLSASGVLEEFEGDERGAGITMFVPTDQAFVNLADPEQIQSLPAHKKVILLKFHVLHSYYPLGSLQSIVNPVQPTLATEEAGAGYFTLNISRFNGSVLISTGLVQASVTQTVFDQNPVSIFGVSKVLLPRDYFSKSAVEIKKPGGDIINAPPPDYWLAPQVSPLQSPLRSSSASHIKLIFLLLHVCCCCCCIGFLYV